nr:GGDEF domain-containing protein [uncultured Actinoplanes sp.]
MTDIERARAYGLPDDRLAARMLAHAMVEYTQVKTDPELIDSLIGEARDAGWAEVVVLMVHCQLLCRSLRGEPQERIRESSDAMISAALLTSDEIFIALSLAARALFVVHAENPDSLGEDDGELLGRAVSMLDDATDGGSNLGLRAIELPVCYVEIGQAYHRLGLWELEEEMYARAAGTLDIPLPPAARHVHLLTRRVLVMNRLENATALACAMLETGDREGARHVAAVAVRPTAAERADLPPIWQWEVKAMERFLDVVAGDPRLTGETTGVSAAHFEALAGSTWSGYRALLLLAAAVGAHDQGDVDRAARLADRAVRIIDDYKPSIQTLALYLAAQSARDSAALRYSRHLASLRWQARLGVLGAARARLDAARVLRQGEQLNRQAYADALTGLANRHAETRHLARLRHRPPQDRIAVVLIDGDYFKTVNDTFGHVVGDEVLRVLGAILQSVVGPKDLAVRLGGDEFMLLIEVAPGSGVPEIADGVVRAVALHRWTDVAPGLHVSVSAGQATGPACEVDRLIRTADANLYRAKAAGRGRAVLASSGTA